MCIGGLWVPCSEAASYTALRSTTTVLESLCFPLELSGKFQIVLEIFSLLGMEACWFCIQLACVQTPHVSLHSCVALQSLVPCTTELVPWDSSPSFSTGCVLGPELRSSSPGKKDWKGDVM